MAGGKCAGCYFALYRAEHAERIAASKQKWHKAFVDKQEQAKKRDELHFGGIREEILRRDGYRCTTCGTSEKLTVHHIDGNGRGSKQPNNAPENLQTLCRSCHMKVHIDI